MILHPIGRRGPAFLFTLSLCGCPQGAGPLTLTDGGPDADVADADADASDATAPGAPTTTPPPATGALCGANGRDECQPLLCDGRLGCVECATHEDCPAGADRCLAGGCVICRPGAVGVSDCPSGEVCWSTDYACHARCKENVECPAGSTCDRSSGACVGCTTDGDCPVGVCETVKRRCVACRDDSTCRKPTPKCHLGTGTCVACLSNDDCGRPQPVCDPLTFRCREGCTSDGQCPAGATCDLAKGRCATAATPVIDAGSNPG